MLQNHGADEFILIHLWSLQKMCTVDWIASAHRALSFKATDLCAAAPTSYITACSGPSPGSWQEGAEPTQPRATREGAAGGRGGRCQGSGGRVTTSSGPHGPTLLGTARSCGDPRPGGTAPWPPPTSRPPWRSRPWAPRPPLRTVSSARGSPGPCSPSSSWPGSCAWTSRTSTSPARWSSTSACRYTFRAEPAWPASGDPQDGLRPGRPARGAAGARVKNEQTRESARDLPLPPRPGVWSGKARQVC